MSNVFFILLLAVGFAGWKALDYFQLPNTFSILLLILTALSGILWCYHRFAVMPRRRRQIAGRTTFRQSINGRRKSEN